MLSPIRNISIKGPCISLEQLIQLRHVAKSLHLDKYISRSSVGGYHRSVFRGRGMDFDEVRIYEAGDDIRNIDWRVTARTTKTHTKIFREEKEQPVFIAVDQSSSMFFGSKVTYKSVMATTLAAMLGWSTLHRQDKIGGIVFNEYQHTEIKPKRNKNSLLFLLKKMVDYNQQLFKEKKKREGSFFHKLLKELCYLAKPGSNLYIISDFSNYDMEAERLLYLVKRHAFVCAIIIVDSMEQQLPTNSQFTITDGTQKCLINTGNNKIIMNYQSAFQEKQTLLRDSFNKLGIDHYLIWTHDDPLQSLQALIRGKPHSVQISPKKPVHAA